MALLEFKVNKRAFKGIELPVAYIGFPETSLDKWMPEGAALEALYYMNYQGNGYYLFTGQYAVRNYSDYYSRWRGQVGLKYTF